MCWAGLTRLWVNKQQPRLHLPKYYHFLHQIFSLIFDLSANDHGASAMLPTPSGTPNTLNFYFLSRKHLALTPSSQILSRVDTGRFKLRRFKNRPSAWRTAPLLWGCYPTTRFEFEPKILKFFIEIKTSSTETKQHEACMQCRHTQMILILLIDKITMC